VSKGPDRVKHVAYHEAGHAVTAFLTGAAIQSVSIVEDGDSRGHVIRRPAVSRHSSVPQSSLGAVSRALDMRNEGQDSSYSAMKESPRNDRIGFAVSTGR